MRVSPVDQMWAMLSPAEGDSWERKGPPRVNAVKVGTLPVALQVHSYYPSSIHLNLRGLANNTLQRDGEMGEGKAEATPPSLRETAANHRPSGYGIKRSLT